jgi:hypothetical protein
MRSFVPLLLLATLAACGAPKAGEKCNEVGFYCVADKIALECRSGAWRELPCRGPDGCKVVGKEVHCDPSQDLAGDACASTVEGKAICEPTGLAVLECRQGEFVKTLTCRTCTSSATEISCVQ